MDINGIQIQRYSNGIVYINENVFFEDIIHILGDEIKYNKSTGVITIMKEGTYFLDWSLNSEKELYGKNNLVLSIVTSEGENIEGSNNGAKFNGYYILTVKRPPFSLSLKNTSYGGQVVLSKRAIIKASLSIFDITKLKGEPGERGPQGDRGLQGPQGDIGAQGPSGEEGFKGINGTINGPTGATGPRGLPGDLGFQGPQGLQGLPGYEGIRGEQGDPGLPGSVGLQGDPGERGLKGDKGPRGIKGIKGLLGPEGNKGPTGPVGIKGLVGLRGPEGPQGPQGQEGAVGLQGPQGPQGPTGETGEPGPSTTSVISVGKLVKESVPHVSAIKFEKNFYTRGATYDATTRIATINIPGIYLISLYIKAINNTGSGIQLKVVILKDDSSGTPSIIDDISSRKIIESGKDTILLGTNFLALSSGTVKISIVNDSGSTIDFTNGQLSIARISS